MWLKPFRENNEAPKSKILYFLLRWAIISEKMTSLTCRRAEINTKCCQSGKDQDKLWNLNLQKMQKLIFLSYFGKCETVTFNQRFILHPNILFQRSQGLLPTLKKFQVLPTLFLRFVNWKKIGFMIVNKTKKVAQLKFLLIFQSGSIFEILF